MPPGFPFQRGGQLFVHHGGPGLLHVLVLAALVLLVVLVVLGLARLLLGRRAAPGALAAGAPDGALALVRLRYAQGELNREEFLRMSGDLGARPVLPDSPPAGGESAWPTAAAAPPEPPAPGPPAGADAPTQPS